MAVNGGSGNAISLGEIQAFYGGSAPTSLSEYNRGGSLVPSTFAGSATATTGTSSQTVDDFGVTVTTIGTGYTGFSTTITQGNSPFSVSNLTNGNWNVIRENAGSGTASWTARVLNSATTLSGSCDGKALTVTKNGSNAFTPLGNSGGSWSVSCSPGDVIVWTCSGGIGGGGTINRSQNWSWSGSPAIQYTANTNGGSTGSITAYNVVFANNTSTGDTYTLTSGSTGSETVYSPGESQTVTGNGSSNSWVIAYDNVTGAGAGSAGDINVTIVGPNYTGALGSMTSRGTAYTVTADDAVIEIVGVVSNDASSGGSITVVHRVNSGSNISQTRSHGGQPGAHIISYYTGPAANGASGGGINNGSLSAGDVVYFISSTSVEQQQGVYSRRRSAQYTTRFTNSGSQSYTLGSSTTGGAAVIAAGATRDVNTTSTSNNPSWAVYFDTSSGNCNTNVPTSIGSGNTANFNIFNAPGTPVG